MKRKSVLAVITGLVLLCFLTGCTPANAKPPVQTLPRTDEASSGGESGEAESATRAPNETTAEEPDPPTPEMIKIACVGDSITAGVGVNDPLKDSYPARLQAALGSEYQVYNYGTSGATMCSSSARLYESKCWFTYGGHYAELMANAQELDVVFIMLGTNDGNTGVEQLQTLFSENLDAFRADYEANLNKLVTELRAKNEDVIIYLMSSPKCFRTGNTWEENLAVNVRPLQKELAESMNLEWYDMYQFTAESVGQKGFPDHLHPGVLGYRLIGRELAGVIARRFRTELVPEEPSEGLFSLHENFDSAADGSIWQNVNLETVTVGGSKLRLKAIEGSVLTVNGGVAALKRGGSDAYFDVMLEQSITEGTYCFEMELKASETFNSRGCLFFVFGRQFARFQTDGSITSVDGSVVFGRLASDRFIKISLTVDTDAQTYALSIDGTQADSGSFLFKETAVFRPVQFFASGDSTIYLDSFRVTQLS